MHFSPCLLNIIEDYVSCLRDMYECQTIEHRHHLPALLRQHIHTNTPLLHTHTHTLIQANTLTHIHNVHGVYDENCLYTCICL